MPLDQIVRPTVNHFSVAMENVLQKHDETKGSAGWKKLRTDQLHDRIREELVKIQERQGDPEAVAACAVDIGNFAMMLWDNKCDQARRDLYGETPA